MDKDASVNGDGRSVLTRLSLLEAKVDLIATTLKWVLAFLLSSAIGGLVTYLVSQTK